jgi:hypothetical protein
MQPVHLEVGLEFSDEQHDPLAHWVQLVSKHLLDFLVRLPNSDPFVQSSVLKNHGEAASLLPVLELPQSNPVQGELPQPCQRIEQHRPTLSRRRQCNQSVALNGEQAIDGLLHVMRVH